MASVEGIVDRLGELAPAMPEAQRSIAELVLADPGAVARMTILDLAERCGVSTGSITRLCRALGLTGYAELRLALASDSVRTTTAQPWSMAIGADVAEDDDIHRIAEVVSATITAAVAETVAGLDLAVLDRVAALLTVARRVWVFGAGGSSTVASELQQRLYHLGIAAWTSMDTHVALSAAALAGPRDVVVSISHGGRTKEAVDLLNEAMSHGATTVAVTNDAESPLAGTAELTLLTSVRETGFRTESLASRHGQLAVVDMLFIAIAQRSFEQAGEAMAAAHEAVKPYKQQS